jgi:hypothetical protein
VSERSFERTENPWLSVHVAIGIVATFTAVTMLLWLVTLFVDLP